MRVEAARRGGPDVNAEAEKYKKLAIFWAKRALAAETLLAIMVEGIVR